MPSLKEVRNRIKSVTATQQITKAMKMVAAAKLRKAQDAIVKLRPYSLKLSQIITNLTQSDADSEELKLFSQKRPIKKVLIVVITSDRGLCGSFNSSVLKYVNQLINEKYAEHYSEGNITVLPLGKKAYDYFLKKKNVEIIDVFYNVFANLKFIEAKKIAEFIMQSFKNKEFDIVEVVFNEFKNVVTQIVKNEQFLPILPKIAEQSKMPKTIDYIFEPNKEAILDDLIPKSIKVQFYRYLLESNASEHGARMTAMDKATENAGELLKELRLTYNRTRQAAITKEILEIVGGAEALKSN
jgi:F-type H+-transporting ATPase subunit gamma